MANHSAHAPQWGGFSNSSQTVPGRQCCSVCLRSDGPVIFSPCVNECTFRTHQRCFDRWKASSATGTCPVCHCRLVDNPDVQVTFPMGTRVVLGSGQSAQLVTVVGFKYLGEVGREYTVATSTGVVFQTTPSTLAHMPMCRVCGTGRNTLEFNPCNCRGSLLQFAHKACLRHGTRCPVCRKTMAAPPDSVEAGNDRGAWDRIKGVLGMT